MVHKMDLKGKYVRFLDKQGKYRTQRVIRIDGSFLTVIDVLKRKSRVHKDRVIGQETRKSGLNSIDWNRRK